MKEPHYLVIQADGSDTIIHHLDAEGLARWLKEAADYANDGGRDPIWLEAWPDNKWSTVEPGSWPEGAQLILRVEIVVPRPVTQKWEV